LFHHTSIALTRATHGNLSATMRKGNNIPSKHQRQSIGIFFSPQPQAVGKHIENH